MNRDADIAMAPIAPADVLDGAAAARAPRVGLRALGRSVARLSDAQLASLIGVALFALSAWPLLLVEVPPLQDLPNHIASVTVLANPSKYPEFVSNGFFKTNTAVFAWLVFAGRVLGINLAAKVFTGIVLAVNAFALPRVLLGLGDRRRMIVGSLFCWPMVHNWFVSMGMLDFALGVPLSLLLLVLLRKQMAEPTLRRAVGGVLLGLSIWYAHVFALMIVVSLVAIEMGLELLRSRGRRTELQLAFRRTVRTLPVLVPPMLLAAFAVARHMTEPKGAMTAFIQRVNMLPPWELGYNMWAEWMWAYSNLTLGTLVPTLALGFLGIARWRRSAPFFSGVALLFLAAAYAFSPYEATNWFHVNSRLIPFLWVGFLLRVPRRLPHWLTAALGVAAISYTVGMGIDYVRLDRERRDYLGALPLVPEGARMLPLTFRAKQASSNTRSLLHLWGYYTAEKHTAAPLLFAHSRSFPVMYGSPPPLRLNHLVLEGFAPNMHSPNELCGHLAEHSIMVNDCQKFFEHTWAEFWAEIKPGYTHVLAWDMPNAVVATVPPEYRLEYHRGNLSLYVRPAQAAAR